MEISIDQQIFEQIRKSNKILIVLPQNLQADALASALGLRLFLSKLEKDVTVASSGEVADNLKFLPGSAVLQTQINARKSLVVTVDTSVKKLEEISYQTQENKAQVFLKAKDQEFTKEDLSFASEKFPVDLIIVLGAKSMEDLGKLYEQNADLFFETPKINIDNHSSNEYFGQLNLVDIAVSSTAEILAGVLQKYEQQLLDEDIATCLLLGIITGTRSFQHVQTTPKAFLQASELVALGARQQEIIKNIYKTKSLPLLKLWGRTLARMKILEETKIIYSVLNLGDFEKAGAEEEELLPVLAEFIDNIGGYKIIAILAESSLNSLRLVAAVHEQVQIENFIKVLGQQGKVLDFNLGNYRIFEQNFEGESLEDLEQRFLGAVKNKVNIT
jgi:nanoRNase/pAp phosphatase (c-di-AMP/oligoRNAs hydrolase)